MTVELYSRMGLISIAPSGLLVNFNRQCDGYFSEPST